MSRRDIIIMFNHEYKDIYMDRHHRRIYDRRTNTVILECRNVFNVIHYPEHGRRYSRYLGRISYISIILTKWSEVMHRFDEIVLPSMI